MKITAYSFGMMRIDGQDYRKDLMILPDGSICHPWWRASGHVLTIDDIGAILNVSPSVLVTGTGDYGLMKPDVEFVAQAGLHADAAVELSMVEGSLVVQSMKPKPLTPHQLLRGRHMEDRLGQRYKMPRNFGT